jgi:hypothetical protein
MMLASMTSPAAVCESFLPCEKIHVKKGTKSAVLTRKSRSDRSGLILFLFQALRRTVTNPLGHPGMHRLAFRRSEGQSRRIRPTIGHENRSV